MAKKPKRPNRKQRRHGVVEEREALITLRLRGNDKDGHRLPPTIGYHQVPSVYWIALQIGVSKYRDAEGVEHTNVWFRQREFPPAPASPGMFTCPGCGRMMPPEYVRRRICGDCAVEIDSLRHDAFRAELVEAGIEII